MRYRRIVRCPSCKEQIDCLESPTKERSGMGEAMLLGDSRRDHARKSPQCRDHPNWFEGWIVDDPVEVP